MSAFQEHALPLGEFILTPDQSRYIVKERYLREFLVQKFGLGIDFKISVRRSPSVATVPQFQSTKTGFGQAD